jgi:hypothetical protein
MALANRPKTADLGDAWRIINGTTSGDDDDEAPEAEHGPVVCSPDRPPADTADPSGHDEDGEPDRPADDRAPPVREADGVTVDADGKPVPERLQPYFADAPLFDQAARRAGPLANLLAEIEQSPAFRKAVEGTKHTLHSTRVRAAGQVISALKPVHPCPACGGAEEPSPENDRCEACAGKGYQTADEVEAGQ